MRILLIKPKHIGDSLILTPTLVAIRRAQPDAEIWVVVRRGCEGILAGCPEIDRILTIAPVDQHERRLSDFWLGLGTALRLLSVRFDYVFELGDGHRGRMLALLSRAAHRYSVRPVTPLKSREERGFDAISTFDWETSHRVEKDFYSVSEFFPLAEPIPPLRFDRQRTRPWAPAEGLSDFCVMQIGKRQSVGRWQRERWEEVGHWLLEHVGPIVIASGTGESETEEAAWLRDRLGPRALATLGQADWAQMAALLYRARLYVGLDTATMHLAAACGCPVVALFGSTYEGHWRPWQSVYRIVTDSEVPPTGEGKENLAQAKQRSMTGITSGKVIAACEQLLSLK